MLQKSNVSRWSEWVGDLSGKQVVKIDDQDATITSRFSWAMFSGQPNARAFDYVLSLVSTWVSPEQVEVIPYTVKDVNPAYSWKNLVITFPGVSSPQETVFLTAHLDSIIVHDGDPMLLAPGADDNGSGAAVLLEAVRLFRSYQFEKTIKVVFFTGEEQFQAGSSQFVATYALGNPVGDINLDMIGYNPSNNGQVQVHAGSSPEPNQLTDCLLLVNQAYQLNLVPQVISENASNRSDHVSFWSNRIPAIWLFDGFDQNGNVLNPNYHRPQDQLDALNPDYALKISRLALATTASLAVTRKECAQRDINIRIETTPAGNTLQWDSAAGIDSYHVLRSTTGCSTGWRSMAVVNQSQWTDNEVQNGVAYSYRVEAMDGAAAGFCTSVSQSCVQSTP